MPCIRLQVSALERENTDLQEKVNAFQAEIDTLQQSHSSDLSQLREALKESVARCRQLEKLNEEAYGVIMLQSAQAAGIVDKSE